jgi:hypothetical protein
MSKTLDPASHTFDDLAETVVLDLSSDASSTVE